MQLKSTLPTLLVGVLGFAAVSQPALAVPLGADYFVRPVLRVGAGEIQDGLQYNGQTQATQSQSVTGYSTSTVNLNDGTVKMYAQESQGLAGLQTFGSFGEEITINNGAGTYWDMSFAIDGSVFGDLEFATPGSQAPSIYYDLSIIVFAEGVATAENFFGLARDPCWGQDPLSCTPAPAPLAYQYESEYLEIPVGGTDDYFYENFYREIFASVLLPSNHEVMDLFVFTNVIVGAPAGAGLANYVSDFSHTASYGQQFAQGVEAYSSSGAFLGLDAPPPVEPPPNGVPAPGILALFGLALTGLGWSRRKAA